MNPSCSTCGHEAHDAKTHHGNHVMDMHHRPTFGPRPNGYGCAIGWEYVRPECTSVLVRYVRPDGVREDVAKPCADAWSTEESEASMIEIQCTGPLKMWRTECGEFCVAETEEGAAVQYQRHTGHRLGRDGEPAGANWPDVEWTEVPADKVLRYTEEDGSVTAHTCAEWVALDGVGYFMSFNV